MPHSSADIHKHKTEYTSAVKHILRTLARNSGHEPTQEESFPYGDPPVRGRCDQVWRSGTQLKLIAECEWYYKTDEQLKDFQKLLEARCPQKLIIHRNRHERIMPAIKSCLSSYRGHPADEEEYIVIRVAGDLGASLLRVRWDPAKKVPMIDETEVGVYAWHDYGRSWGATAEKRSPAATRQKKVAGNPVGRHLSDLEIEEVRDIANECGSLHLVDALRGLNQFLAARPKSSFGGSIRYTRSGIEVCQVLLRGELGDVPPANVDVRVIVDRVSEQTRIPPNHILTALRQNFAIVCENKKQTRKNAPRQELYVTVRLSTPEFCVRFCSQLSSWFLTRND